jgi:hypothetical protein
MRQLLPMVILEPPWMDASGDIDEPSPSSSTLRSLSLLARAFMAAVSRMYFSVSVFTAFP